MIKRHFYLDTTKYCKADLGYSEIERERRVTRGESQSYTISYIEYG